MCCDVRKFIGCNWCRVSVTLKNAYFGCTVGEQSSSLQNALVFSACGQLSAYPERTRVMSLAKIVAEPQLKHTWDALTIQLSVRFSFFFPAYHTISICERPRAFDEIRRLQSHTGLQTHVIYTSFSIQQIVVTLACKASWLKLAWYFDCHSFWLLCYNPGTSRKGKGCSSAVLRQRYENRQTGTCCMICRGHWLSLLHFHVWLQVQLEVCAHTVDDMLTNRSWNILTVVKTLH